MGWTSHMETELWLGKTRRTGNAECGQRTPSSEGCRPAVAEGPSGGREGGAPRILQPMADATTRPCGRAGPTCSGRENGPGVQMGRKTPPLLAGKQAERKKPDLGLTLCSALPLPPVPSVGGGPLVAQHCPAGPLEGEGGSLQLGPRKVGEPLPPLLQGRRAGKQLFQSHPLCREDNLEDAHRCKQARPLLGLPGEQLNWPFGKEKAGRPTAD